LTTNAWGAPNVLPRDPQNGLEDPTMKQWCYWDGQIIKGPDGKYHMFASRWDQARGHGGWGNSLAVHAVSDNPVGPYIDKGVCWPDSLGGKGHNVTALVLPNDEGYAVIVSETRPGAVFVSKSLDGPWTMKGLLTVEGQPNWRASNVSVMVRPDGDYMIVPRNGRVMISKAADGVCGPYKIVGPAYPTGIPNLEDPSSGIAAGFITSSSIPGARGRPTTSRPRTAKPTGSTAGWRMIRGRILCAIPMAPSTIGTRWNVPACCWKTAT
jgi:hypothetical protein